MEITSQYLDYNHTLLSGKILLAFSVWQRAEEDKIRGQHYDFSLWELHC